LTNGYLPWNFENRKSAKNTRLIFGNVFYPNARNISFVSQNNSSNDQMFGRLEHSKCVLNKYFTPDLKWCSCCSTFTFLCNDLSAIVCLFVLFLLAIVLSDPLFMASDYPFGIFKLFLHCYKIIITDCVFMQIFLRMGLIIAYWWNNYTLYTMCTDNIFHKLRYEYIYVYNYNGMNNILNGYKHI